MRLASAALLLPVLAVLLIATGSATAESEQNPEDTTFRDEDPVPNEKISVSLKLSDDSERNKTENIRDSFDSAKVSSRREYDGQVTNRSKILPPRKLVVTPMSSRMLNESSSRSLFSFSGRNNATRRSSLPIDTEATRRILSEEEEIGDETPEELPEAQELRLFRPSRGRRPFHRPQPPNPPLRRSPQSNRRNVFPAEGLRSSPKRPSRRPTTTPETKKKEPDSEGCKFFTKTVCLEAINYPHEAIMRSIRGNKEMAAALLTDYKSQDSPESGNRPMALPLENRYERYEKRYENNEIKRRADYSFPSENVEEGFTCPSLVMYARPQLARAVSGVWKYIINTGEHTQTLRLEKCSNPKASCSFISENYRSSCTQVYNYHRLLTWESSLGLHMDIFKVPTCCSCHVHGYADLYPPIQKDPPPSPKERFPGAEFATEDLGPDESEFSERPSSYLTKFKPSSSFDANFVPASKKPSINDAGTSNRPSYTLPGRRKKPSSASRPYDKLPQQHAPNTRAPGYKGPIMKSKRPARPNRPYRRESNTDLEESPSSSIMASSGNNNWFSGQSYDHDTDTSSGLHNGGFDEEYQDTNRRINYDYHPIIDFFKPEASMLQSPEALAAAQTSPANGGEANSDSWKPMIAA